MHPALPSRSRAPAARGGRRPTPQVVITAASADDLPAMAAAHVRMLPVGLFPTLGETFVSRWHGTYLDSPHGLAFVAVERGTRTVLHGFLVGSTDEAAHITEVLARPRTLGLLALTGAVALLTRPGAAIRLVRTRARPWFRRLLISRRTRRPRAAQATPGDRVAVLAAVAVSPELRGHGLGAELTARFVERARAAQSSRAELVTVTGSTGACGFYERLGWHPVGERRMRDGEVVRVYRHMLAAPAPPPRVAADESSSAEMWTTSRDRPCEEEKPCAGYSES